MDPGWLRQQQTKRLDAIIDAESQHLRQRAKAIEERLLQGEQQEVMALINKQAPSAELQRHFLNKLRSQAFAQQLSAAYGGDRDAILNQAIVAQLEHALTSEQFGDKGTPFDLTAFIMDRLQLLDRKAAAPKRPNKTVLDEPRHKW